MTLIFWKKRTAPRARLQELIGDYDLPSFSSAAVSTLRLLRSDTDMSEIADHLMADPGLSVRILRTVNSSAFGLRQKVSNLEHAANLLGRARIESIVLTAAVGCSLPSPCGIDTVDFWQTSARRACFAKHLAELLHPSEETEIFTAALLQDMAIPVLAESVGSQYIHLYAQAQASDSTSLHQMEEQELGYTHAEIGSLMAETWELPAPLVAAIADHHLAGSRAPVAVEAVSLIRGCTDVPDDFCTRCIEHLKLEPSALERIIAVAESESFSLSRAISQA